MNDLSHDQRFTHKFVLSIVLGMVGLGCTLSSKKSGFSGLLADAASPDPGRPQTDEIDLIDTDSPMTSLAKAIRKKVVLDLTLKEIDPDAPPRLPLDNKTFPRLIKEAILEHLKAQKTLATDFQPPPNRPCSIDGGLFTPKEIIYSLQRAALGSPSKDDFTGVDQGLGDRFSVRYGKFPWKMLLNYPTDQVGLNLFFEIWFKQLEEDSAHPVPRIVSQSLGLKRVSIPRWVKFSPQIAGEALGAPGKEARCFVSGQLETMGFNDTAPSVAMDSLRELDVFEGVTTVSLDIHTGAPISLALGRYLAHRPTVRGLAMSTNGINEMEAVSTIFGCDIRLMNLDDQIPQNLRRQITRIRINTGAILSYRWLYLRVFVLSDQAIAAKFFQALRRTFPAAVDFAIESSYNDTPEFTAALLNLADQEKARKVHVILENPDAMIRRLPFLRSIQSLTFERAPTSREYLNIPMFLTKFKNIPKLRTKGFSFVGSEKELGASSLKSKAQSLRFTGCNTALMPMNTSFRMTTDHFPNLRNVVVQNCPGFVTSASPRDIEVLVRQSRPDELVEILREMDNLR